MATINEIVFKHHFKKNNTANVKIRVTHKREHSYIDTAYFVTLDDLTKGFELKSMYVNRYLANELTEYRDILNYLGNSIDKYTVKELRNILVDERNKKNHGYSENESIDFIKFSREYIEKLIEEGKKTSAVPLTTAVNHLVDFKGEYIPAQIITSRFLARFEEFLKKPRRMVRTDQFGIKRTTKTEGISKRGASKVSANIRLLFNKCKEEYNDEEIGDIVIGNNPFAKHKIKIPLKKTERSLEVEDLTSIRDLNLKQCDYRVKLGRDMLMLSFYLCGMNSVDIYNNIKRMDKDTIKYQRSKTQHRSDGAHIEVPIPEEAKEIIKNYSGMIPLRYSNPRYFNKAINTGLNVVAGKVYLTDLTHYYARHTFATIAHNICGYSLEDIGVVLNHVPKNNQITSIYISTDWSIIGRIQNDVLNVLRNDDNIISLSG